MEKQIETVQELQDWLKENLDNGNITSDSQLWQNFRGMYNLLYFSLEKSEYNVNHVIVE
jgi:hypothetical protein